MAFEGSDFGFVGQSYEATMQLQDYQTCINWYLEHSEDEKSKMPDALLGCPGLNPQFSTTAGQARGGWVLPGNTQALVVTGSFLYLVTISAPATQTSPPVFNVAQVGTLLTAAGPVVIRDNGVQSNGLGGYAVIVDGTFGYAYRLSGTASQITFTAGVSSGSGQITFPGTIPNGLIILAGTTLTDSAGAIPGGTTLSAVNTVSVTATMSQNATATSASDSLTLTIPQFGQIVDAGFLGADRVDFIEGWLIFNQPGTRTFFTNGPIPYSMLFPGSFANLKDSSTDNLVTLHANERELWLIGERTSEVWYNSGISANFAFSRIPGVGPQIGCAAKHSITRLGPDIVWLARNEQGENFVAKNAQYSWERLSTHAIDHAISQYPVVSDAIGFAYEEEGHFFYMLTFPTADVTWCYDGKTKKWHRRASFDPVLAQFHRHRANAFMDFADVRLVGDYQTGQWHQMSRAVFTDAGNPLVCLRRSPHVWSKENRERVFCSQLQIEFTPGVGLQSGQGSQPTAMLRFSDDGGFTWSNQMTASIGVAGATKNRCMFYLLGYADRDRVWELTFSDPVQRDIIGATLWAERAAA